MRNLIFDPFSGASGDMILASLIGLGADRTGMCEMIESTVDVSVSVDLINKKGIDAVNVHIETHGKERSRSYYELVDIIKHACLPSRVEKSALAVFGIMGEAESRIHGQSLEELHFHEVGQNDAIADVLGACYAIHETDVNSILCTPINVGGGSVRVAHGRMPVPAPATLAILQEGNLSFYGSGDRELLTPTGAALLVHFARPIANIPVGNVLSVGYGAGDADTDGPNVLRTMIMQMEGSLFRDRIEVLETNVDDVTGEVLGNLFDKLLSMGALDVAIIPATMKKGRTGHIITVITKPEHSETIARLIIRETGSLGVRVIPTKHRFIADRRIENVTIELNGQEFDVGVKVACDQRGDILNVSAEYEDCKTVSDITQVPIKEIIGSVEDIGRNRFMSKWSK
ncbi:MAG: nickel pincer cofactor biosynthesis protein LarC [Methanosarcinaceae archaeon]|nr:nickel pincer cofactor biosynthesis protein LarC [Methanosarcinaceae archaeon]